MSSIRSIRLGSGKVVIGESTVDRETEERAENLLKSAFPGLIVVTTREGKRQIPLTELLALEQRAQAEKEAAYQKGLEEGRQAGYAEGLNKGQEEARRVVASLSGLLKDITGQRQTILLDAKDHIFELILKISQKLTFEATRLSPDITMSIISGAIDNLLDRSRIKVKVSPEHLPEIEQHIDKFRGRDTAIKEFIIEADPRVRGGGCFIETPTGDIDARLESMYDIIRDMILQAEDTSL